ncbi:dienelactone hydrolase [Lasiosphaeria hispida]|uniref:Dienelactone hydrolase n=1 Tax=Lasiosphaeria hispida TaxID=260671 RepID=A0AAJ0M8X4_9PEZI|nr:dienelactone hydrolase [Lasiosphaeria hispida]
MSCPDCFKGTLRGDVIPRGKEAPLHGLDTYTSTPPPGAAPLGTVILIADAFGWKLRNTRALADAYAARVPCTVHVPDVMGGRAPPEALMALMEYTPPAASWLPVRLALRAWALTRAVPLLARFLFYNRRSVVRPRVLAFVRAVRAEAGPQAKVGVAGFCWGGMYAVQLTHDAPENMSVNGRAVVDCAFTAHPTFTKVPGDVEKVVRPLSVANGDDDEQMGARAMVRLRAILDAKNEAAGELVHEAVVYPGARHGFAVRGDRADALQKERGERSEEQAVRWFRVHFQG